MAPMGVGGELGKTFPKRRPSDKFRSWNRANGVSVVDGDQALGGDGGGGDGDGGGGHEGSGGKGNCEGGTAMMMGNGDGDRRWGERRCRMSGTEMPHVWGTEVCGMSAAPVR